MIKKELNKEGKLRTFCFSFFLLSFLLFSIILMTETASAKVQQQFTEGYIIQYAPQDYVINERDYTFNFKVYNISNGVIISNSTTTCDVYVANQTGDLLSSKSSTYVVANKYWYANFKGGNFTGGYYYYGISCQATKLGGSIVGKFTTTDVGGDRDSKYEFLIIFLLIIAAVMIIGFAIKNPWVLMLGSILILIFGFYIIINGVIIFKDTQTTWAIGLIVWALGVYFIYLSIEEQLKEGR